MTKMVKVSYSFYKKYFRECKTGEYDEKRKTIEIEVPKRPPFPKEWKADGGYRYTPDGIKIYTYGSGYQESYLVSVLHEVELSSGEKVVRETTTMVRPGVNARQQVMDVVAEYAEMPNIKHSVFEKAAFARKAKERGK